MMSWIKPYIPWGTRMPWREQRRRRRQTNKRLRRLYRDERESDS